MWVACVMLDTVDLPVTSKSAPLVLILFLDTVTKLDVIALVVVFATTLMVSVLASLVSLVPDASTRPLLCKLIAYIFCYVFMLLQSVSII
jgi:hypothetical protein